ncbi:MAG: leucyl/phenylalanyl-tRNA--protein transferase [Polyangiaceae bacterium]
MSVAPPVPFPPIDPGPARVVFPDPSDADADDIVAAGCDFSASTLVLAYRSGIFPWPHGKDRRGGPLVLWFSPDPRCIFPIEREPHWSRSLRRTLRHHPYEITVDQAFEQVMLACARQREGGTWIIPELVAGYVHLHALGWAHSVEVWDARGPERELVGGIYGVSIGGLFAGESMFHARTDASKIAFAALVERLRSCGYVLFDVQVQNPHLLSLGCVEIQRSEYLQRLTLAVETPTRPLG